VIGVAGIECLAELVPVLGEHGRDVVGVERLVLVGESDPAVQLWVAGELPVEAGHADQDQSEIASVEEVPELFQPSGSQAVSFIDDHQLCAALGFFVVELGVVSRVGVLVTVLSPAPTLAAGWLLARGNDCGAWSRPRLMLTS
jgi:hypothetical protein